MSASHQNSRKSIHQLAFQHYLRTGQRLTNGEWSALHERKFNPYHDERGRFTSPPGAIISWGKYGGPRDNLPSEPRDQLQDRENTSPSLRIKDDLSEAQAANISGGGGDPLVPNQEPSHGGFRSDFVRNAVPSQTGHAETYFELNRRQAYLDQLRREAGKNANALVKADLDDFQKRLDSDRIRLDEINRRIIDKYTSEILRAGVAPIDVGIGALNIVSADGELRDYLAVAGAIPLGGIVGKIGRGAAAGSVVEVVQLGGAYSAVRKLRGYHAHHIPAKKASSLSISKGPSIAMLPKDHRRTLSYGRGAAAKAHRAHQADLIAKGDFRGAQQLDIDDIRTIFGNKYDHAIEQMLRYSEKMGL